MDCSYKLAHWISHATHPQSVIVSPDEQYSHTNYSGGKYFFAIITLKVSASGISFPTCTPLLLRIITDIKIAINIAYRSVQC